MADLSHCVAFFDIGDTLASVRISADGNDIDQMVVFDGIPAILDQLQNDGVHLGIISNSGTIPKERVNDALERAGLLQYFNRKLIIYGPKNSTEIFVHAAFVARKVLRPPNFWRLTMMFVGEDANERAYARAVGFLVAPHPRLAGDVLTGNGALRFLRIRIPQRPETLASKKMLSSLPIVPVHTSVIPNSDTVEIYAIGSTSIANRLDDLGFWVDRLGAPDEPATSDLYILRDDRQAESGFLEDDGNSADVFGTPESADRVLSSTHEGLLITVPAGRSVESYHFSAARHGHNLKLMPSPTLFEPNEPEENERLAATLAASSTLFTDDASLAETFASTLTNAQKATLNSEITEAGLKRDVERYSGARPVSGSSRVKSRHIHHPSNAESVRALVKDLKNTSTQLTVRTHRFTHEGKQYDNIEAIWPGSGLPGIVLVTAHMDSTAARQAGYRASIDPAPGADDDASGVAAVLATARAFLKMPAAPRREVRFVLFNAEEHGLIGSRAYAREQAQIQAKIVAVFQLDMVGFDLNPGRTFELHAGFTPSANVQQRSMKLAKLVASIVPEVSPTLPAPQLYPSNNLGDPAESRSDHYSFQREGYAACLASEDFFAGPGPGAPDPNPNYHLPADNAVNAAFAADISRAVAAAAWVTSTT
ncbi:MAG TPA: M20/M25/M40 family metallo-hydrolase [Pyrinomonadaceae bacterium]|nr:M20/M25/M40 family metallo-hydrolase [Pyrinomonadaceae bacterium]